MSSFSWLLSCRKLFIIQIVIADGQDSMWARGGKLKVKINGSQTLQAGHEDAFGTWWTAIVLPLTVMYV